MKYQVEFEGYSPGSAIRNLIESRVEHVDRVSGGLRGDTLFLRVQTVPCAQDVRIPADFRPALRLQLTGQCLDSSEFEGPVNTT